MDVIDKLSPDNTIVDVRAAEKVKLLRDLSRRVALSADLGADIVSSEILRREELGSTGLGDGVAIPHARFGDLKSHLVSWRV